MSEDTAVVATPADDLLNLSATIKEELTRLDKLKDQARELKDMLDAVFMNDSVYQSHDTAVKDATNIRSATKKQIQKQPQVIDLIEKIAALKSQIKETNQQLSDYLQAYAQITGSRQFEDANGVLLDIVYTARLTRPS